MWNERIKERTSCTWAILEVNVGFCTNSTVLRLIAYVFHFIFLNVFFLLTFNRPAVIRMPTKNIAGIETVVDTL